MVPLALIARYLILNSILENLMDANFKYSGDFKCQLEGWTIFPGFDGIDRLSGAAYSLGQLLLSHFSPLKTQPADIICKMCLFQGKSSLKSSRCVKYFRLIV